MHDYRQDGKWYIFSHPVEFSVKHHVCTYNYKYTGRFWDYSLIVQTVKDKLLTFFTGNTENFY